MTPDVSVIVPVYKTEPYLPACLDSLLAQTLENIEIIAVDDGSPDGCGAICDEYAQKDRRVRVIHKLNGGVASALREGMLAATAEHVGFVDSDDWVDADFFKRLLQAAEERDADIVTTRMVEHDPRGETCLPVGGASFYPGPHGGRDLLDDFFSASIHSRTTPAVTMKCDKLFRRQLLLDNLPYLASDVWCGEDLLMNIAMLADCRQVLVLTDGPEYHYRRLESSAAHTFFGPVYTDRHVQNDLALQDMLMRIVRDKGLDQTQVYAYRGQYAYWLVFYLCDQKTTLAQKHSSVRRMLSAVPKQCLREFPRARKNPVVTVFCALLRARAVTACLAIVRLWKTAEALLGIHP